MKIGIITHHYIKNYGAFLQTYALQQYLIETYPQAEVVIVNYVNKKHKIINIGGCFRFFWKKESLKAYLEKIKIPATFSKAEKKYLNITKPLRNAEEINALGLDCIIIGSDEVWHYEDKAASPIKFAVGLRAKKILSYAPSCGGVNLEHPIPDYVKKGLHNFTGISARDDLSEALVHRVLGYKPVRVLDPTLLYDFPVYEDEFTKKLKQEKYILMYYCDKLPAEGIEAIKKYAKENNLKIYGAGEYAKYYSDVTINVSPFQWVEMFRNASFVFTGTFHGAVFSLITERNFATYLTNPSRVKKVSSLLEQFSLRERIIEEENLDKIQLLLKEEIDYSTFNEKKKKVREVSYSFLERELFNNGE
ncbi:MAG: polysaccharide pyruvyl transferase family protein [Lachnospiraceae bacterium]|nr:polysaccharide pyruvyl transferase family protein [Lachnospiraceae bacterium]